MSDINCICERIVTRQRIRCFAIKSQQQIDRSTDAFYVQLKPTLLSKEAGTSSKWTDKDKKALRMR